MSATQRVEILLLAQMAWAIVEAGVNDREHEDAKASLAFFKEAMAEPVKGLMPKEIEKLVRRTGRAHLEVTAPYRHEGGRVDKVGLMFFFILKSLTDCEHLVLGEESAMQKGLDLLLPALEHSASIEPLIESAKKQAAKMLSHLQRLGYFYGVPFTS